MVVTPHNSGILIAEIFVVLVGIVLVSLIVAFVVSKKFRDYLSDDRPKPDSSFPIASDQDPRDIFFQELYDIWIGRVGEIISHIQGRKNVIGRAHYLSILLWLLIIAIADLDSFFSIGCFWQVAIVIFFFTVFYSGLKSGWAPSRYTWR